MYVHFTSRAHAQQIVNTATLKPCTYLGTTNDGPVFAVAVGGSYVPSVQQSSIGATADRSCAVIFETHQVPDFVFPEEVIWKDVDRLAGLPIQYAFIVAAEEAAQLLTNEITEP